jgi:hypothetical protein
MPKLGLSTSSSPVITSAGPQLTRQYVYQSDFSEDADGWSFQVNGTWTTEAGVTYEGKNNVLKFTSVAGFYDVLLRSPSIAFEGETYTAEAEIYVPTDGTGTKLSIGSLAFQSGTPTADQWSTISVSFTTSSTYGLAFYVKDPENDQAVNAFTGYIASVKVYYMG